MCTPKGCRLEMCVPRRPSQTKCAFPSSLVVVIVIVIVVVAVYTENQRPASPVKKVRWKTRKQAEEEKKEDMKRESIGTR